MEVIVTDQINEAFVYTTDTSQAWTILKKQCIHGKPFKFLIISPQVKSLM